MQFGIQFFKTQSPWGWEIIKGDLSIENIWKHCLKKYGLCWSYLCTWHFFLCY